MTNTGGTPLDTEPMDGPARASGGNLARSGSRTSGVWFAVVGFAVLLLLLAIFLLQNGRQVPVSYLGFTGHLPLAVAMLLSAVLGALLVATAGAARILQLRRVARAAKRG